MAKSIARNELKLLIGLHRAVNYIDQQTAKLCAGYQLTLSQFAVLEALYHKGALSVGQVQEKILSTSGTITVIINNLETRGYIRRETDLYDKRRFILDLTDSGRRLIACVYPENETKIIDTMGVWTAQEQQTLVMLLKKFGDEIYGA